MRTHILPVLVAAAAASVGCQNKHGTSPIIDDRGAYNAWTIESMSDGAVRNAIIAQHTLYPYHFVEFSDQLNDLGRRDAKVLASHYRRYPGDVNVRRGPEPDALYHARVKSVADALTAGGVPAGSIRISDRMPGGDGLDAARVISIMEGERQRLSGDTSTQSGSATTARPATSPTSGMSTSGGYSR